MPFAMAKILTEFAIKDLNRILERDATDTTYKYALLRATSHIVGTHQPLKKESDKVWYPTGFLVEKWIEYYYPVIDSEIFIPQKNAEKEHDNGGRKIAFRLLFRRLTEYYRPRGGFKAFWSDYKKGTIHPEINQTCLDFAKSIWYTITRYPMKHLGYSVTGEHHSYYDYTSRSRIPRGARFSQTFLINSFGGFSLDASFYETLKTFGYYVSGEYSILSKWIEFTVKADPTGTVKPDYVFQVLSTSPEQERDVHDSQIFFRDLMRVRDGLECTWSGRRVDRSDLLAIDHVIPFSVWRNNDLWNLLPVHVKVNMLKRDMIPSVELLEDRRDFVLGYWEALLEGFRYRFSREVEVSVLDASGPGWSLDFVFDGLVEKCNHLVEVRGLPAWSLRG